MISFNADLDNTLIYSYKHDIGDSKVNVEVYQNREVSFMTAHSYELLSKLAGKILIVPTTTRTIEQYKRIHLGIGMPRFSLVCNGGILLESGIINQKWYNETIDLIEDSQRALEKAIHILNKDNRRNFEVRFIENLFVFTKCAFAHDVADALKAQLDQSVVDVFNMGEKVYVIPKKLSKGIATQRFRNYIGSERMIAAGDSEFDISMLNAADISYAPKDFEMASSLSKNVKIIKSNVFSDGVLEDIFTMLNALEI